METTVKWAFKDCTALTQIRIPASVTAMKQSLSRVAKCIDNGPMEGFWGILKRERYYGKRFTSKKELVDMIQNYIRYGALFCMGLADDNQPLSDIERTTLSSERAVKQSDGQLPLSVFCVSTIIG